MTGPVCYLQGHGKAETLWKGVLGEKRQARLNRDNVHIPNFLQVGPTFCSSNTSQQLIQLRIYLCIDSIRTPMI